MERYNAERRRAIAVIESLRAGIPTRTSTRELPDLRAALTEQLRQDLNQFIAGKRPPGRLIWGPYGQGKTHVLTTAEHVALDLGFAVSRVSLSREVSCHHLFNFYGRIASAIRTPDSKMVGMARALHHKTVGNLANSPIQQPDRYSHPLPAIILEDYFLTTGEEQDMLYSDLTGTRIAMPELKRIHRACKGQPMPKFEVSFRITQHGDAYVGLMADAIALCGYKGWVLLIDEVELVGRLGKVGRLQAYRNLYWLLNWAGTMPYPIYTVGVAASSLRNDVWFSGTTGTTAKNDRTLIPDLAAEKCGDAAKAEIQAFFDKAISPHCPTIKPLQQQDVTTLLTALVGLHGTAYGWEAKLDVENLLRAIGNQPIRTYIRATLEALDMAYLYKEAPTLGVAELTEFSVGEDEGFFHLDEE